MNQIYVLGLVYEGPFTAAEIRAGLSTGQFRADQAAYLDPAHRAPLHQVLQKVEGTPHYAKFMQRFWAVAIDSSLLWTEEVIGAVIIYRLFGVNIIAHLPYIASGLSFTDVAFIVYNVFCIVATIAYFAILESSPYQATLGKMALGIKVTDSNGDRIVFQQAINRATGRMISYALGNLGFLMAITDEKCLTLHDVSCFTLVLNRHSGYHLTKPIPNPPYDDIKHFRSEVMAYNINSLMTFLGRSEFILLSLLFYILALFTNTLEVEPHRSLSGIVALLLGWVPFGTLPFAFGLVAWLSNIGFVLALLLIAVGKYYLAGRTIIGSLAVACFTFAITGILNGNENTLTYDHVIGFGPGVLLWFISQIIPLLGAIFLGFIPKVVAKKTS